MNTMLITSLYFPKGTKLTKISDEGINFENTHISHEHIQDCCEEVYADWNSLKDQPIMTLEKIIQVDWNSPKDQPIMTLEKIIQVDFVMVKNSGIILDLFNQDYQKYSFFVPCYNVQNGYYSNDLKLIIQSGHLILRHDVSGATHYEDV